MAETCSAHFPNCSQYSLFISTGWMMSQPEMMNYGVANQTSELPLALLHTPTCVLLDRPCTETKEANEGPVGLWIRRLYQGFNVVLLIPLGRGVTLILSTSPQQHTSTMFLIVCEKTCLFLLRCIFACILAHKNCLCIEVFVCFN